MSDLTDEEIEESLRASLEDDVPLSARTFADPDR